MGDYLSISETAARLNVSRKWVIDVLHSGRISGRRSGTHWQIDWDSVLQWRQSKAQPIRSIRARESVSRERLRQLLQTQALSRGHFILASGKESTFYLDGRMVTLSPEGAFLTGKLLFERMHGLDIHAVGGLTMGADPIATAVAIFSHLSAQPIPAFLVRKDVKAHGTHKQVEGPLPPNARVAIVEDTVTTGDSALKAIAAVEALGCTVVIVLALIDRLDGGRERLEAAGYPFASLFTIRDLGIE